MKPMDPVKVKIDGLPSSSATTMVLFGGVTIGTAMAYVGNRILQPHPHLDPGYHLAQRGPTEMILAGLVLGVAGREAFRYLRNV
jgi:hypothetical protein